MAHYDLEEQEQIDTLKTWWKLYGNLVTGLVMAGSLAVVGWQGWNWYQGGQGAKAAAIYGVLEQAAAPPLGTKRRQGPPFSIAMHSYAATAASACKAIGFGVGSPIFVSRLRSVWWNGSSLPRMSMTVSSS